MSKERIAPLQEIVQRWKQTTNEQENLAYFQACSDILKAHFDASLNEDKTDYKNFLNIDQTQIELEEIIQYIVSNVIDPTHKTAYSQLHGLFGIEMVKYQTQIFRDAQKKRDCYSNREPQLDIEIKNMSIKTSKASKKEIDVEADDSDDEEEGDEGDEGEDDEGEDNEGNNCTIDDDMGC